MNHTKKYFLGLFTFFVLTITTGWAQVFPVQINSTLLPPYSLYLGDYSSPTENLWQISMKFLDFNDPARDVRMELSIEGEGIYLKTLPEASADNGFTILPGEIITLSGADLAPYLDINHLDLAGITRFKLESGGRLPEGNYNFCIKIFDASTGEQVSDNYCIPVWLTLTDPPVTNIPACGEIVPTSLPLAMNFQWQQANIMSPNSMGTEYQLTIFELQGHPADPISAISNGQALQIFQSDYTMDNNYIYGLSEAAFDEGKTYAYYVHARDLGGRDLFKNNGYSQICWFHYGYPTGGAINLISPKENQGFTKYENQYFQWSAPDNLVDGQNVRFLIEIAEIHPGQNAEIALTNNNLWFSEETNEVPVVDGWDLTINKNKYPLEKGKQYAWQVTSYTEETETAKSKPGTFFGPPIIDEFNVHTHRVIVTSLSSQNLNDLSGTCKVELIRGRPEYTVEVPFEHLKIKSFSGLNELEEGIISGQAPDGMEVKITPEYASNGAAYIEVDEFRLSINYNLDLKGSIRWPLPLVSEDGNEAFVTTTADWIEFSEFLPTMTQKVSDELHYKLLDPYGFEMVLNTDGFFNVNVGKFITSFDGYLQTPSMVTGRDKDHSPRFPFTKTNQLFYFHTEGASYASILHPLESINIYLQPQAYTIDLSDSISTSAHESSWKGVHLDRYNLNFATIQLPDKGISFPTSQNAEFKSADTSIAFIDQQGLTSLSSIQISNEVTPKFNTFPAHLTSWRMEVLRNTFIESNMLGELKIPFISATNTYPFTIPISENGYHQGYLNESLEGKFTFNKGQGEQEVEVEILRAVFENKDHLRMDLSLNWAVFDLKIDLADDFCVWGNYNVGFKEPNGALALLTQVPGNASGYEMAATHIGAGRTKNLYALGFTGTVNIGEDASGDNGLPEMNSYSIYESPLIPESYTYSQTMEDESSKFVSNSSIFTNEKGEGTEIYLEHTYQKTDELIGSLEDQFQPRNQEVIVTDSGRIVQDISPIYSFDYSEEESSLTLEQFYDLIDLIAMFVSDETKVKIEAFKIKLQTIEGSEVAELYRDLKEKGFSAQSVINHFSDKLISKLNKPIDDQVRLVNGKIVQTVDTLIDPIADLIDITIEKTLDGIRDQVMGLMGSKASPSVGPVLDTIIMHSTHSVQHEFRRSLTTSVHNNVTYKITGFIDRNIGDRLKGYVDGQIRALGSDILQGDLKEFGEGRIFTSAIDTLSSIGNDIVNTVSSIKGDDIKEVISSTAEDAYGGINWNWILQDIIQQVGHSYLGDSIKGTIVSMINKAAGFEDGSLGGGMVGGLAQKVRLDFSNLGEKLKDGKVSDVVSFDAMVIVVKSKIVDFRSEVKFTENDPVWGDCFKGDIQANVKIPAQFSVSAQYINGKVEDYKYWFLELSVPSGLNVPVLPGVLALDGVGGKIFSRMRFNRETWEYTPDKTNRFGAGLEMYFKDIPSNGMFIKLKATAEVNVSEDYFTMELRGDVGVAFTGGANTMDFSKAVVSGNGFIAFSSQDNSLVGRFNVNLNMKPIICAEGQLGFEISPDYWEIYVGKELNPITVEVLCLNFLKVQMWLHVSKELLAVGLKVHFEAFARSPWFKVLGTEVQPYAGFMFHLEVATRIAFQPKIRLEEALFHIEIFAGIGVNWKRGQRSGTWNLVAVEFKGMAHYINTPEDAYVYGELSGKVEIIGIKIGVGLKLEKSLKSLG